MAETRTSVSLAYADSDGVNRAGLASAGAVTTVATEGAVSGRLTVGTSVVSIPVGSLTPRLLALVNRSTSSQTVTLYKASGGATLATLLAGEPALIPLPSGVTAPVVTASAAGALLDFAVCNT